MYDDAKEHSMKPKRSARAVFYCKLPLTTPTFPITPTILISIREGLLSCVLPLSHPSQLVRYFLLLNKKFSPNGTAVYISKDSAFAIDF